MLGCWLSLESARVELGRPDKSQSARLETDTETFTLLLVAVQGTDCLNSLNELIVVDWDEGEILGIDSTPALSNTTLRHNVLSRP